MLRASVLAVLAGTAFCGCVAPVTPAERLAADVANCRRHAIQGPGGPSSVVGDRAVRGGVLNRNNGWDLQTPENAESQREAIYRECLENRGYALPRGGERPVDPDTIGGAGHGGVPV